MKCHYVRDQVRANKIKLKYSVSKNRIAGIMTKGIGKIHFDKLRNIIGLEKFTDCKWGGVLETNILDRKKYLKQCYIICETIEQSGTLWKNLKLLSNTHEQWTMSESADDENISLEKMKNFFWLVEHKKVDFLKM